MCPSATTEKGAPERRIGILRIGSVFEVTQLLIEIIALGDVGGRRLLRARTSRASCSAATVTFTVAALSGTREKMA
jgi:hypothetical protein